MTAEVSLEDLALMPERQARRSLAGHPVRFSLLAPVGAFMGRGVLRVLRARPVAHNTGQAFTIELVCGYESYCGLEPR
ncbi:MAG TPA: hypothetical protein VFE17_08225 [Candidatus Baltobacteraceae bacterium]|nr:hypothetical protein [Candidatus Baltobacteraceae bacterium]